jgi:hypothetical protein
MINKVQGSLARREAPSCIGMKIQFEHHLLGPTSTSLISKWMISWDPTFSNTAKTWGTRLSVVFIEMDAQSLRRPALATQK